MLTSSIEYCQDCRMGARRWKEPVNHPTFVLPRPWPTHRTRRRQAFFSLQIFLKSNQQFQTSRHEFPLHCSEHFWDQICLQAPPYKHRVAFGLREFRIVWIKPAGGGVLLWASSTEAWRCYRDHPCLSGAFPELCHRNSNTTCHSATPPAREKFQGSTNTTNTTYIT